MGRLKFYQTSCRLSQMRNNYEVMRKAADRWSCYVYKNKSKRLREEEKQFLGMLSKPTDNMKEIIKDEEEHIERNKKKAEENINHYEYDKIVLEEEMLMKEGPSMAENLKYNIIQWLLEIKNLLGVFRFPDEKTGGSSFLFSSKTVKQVEEEIREMFDDQKSRKSRRKRKRKRKKQKESKKVKKGEEEEFEWNIPKSQVMSLLGEERDEYMKYWFYKDETQNIHQKHDVQILKEAIRLKISEQIRLEVDKLMRFELENMKIAIERVEGQEKGKQKKRNLSNFLALLLFGTNTQESNLNPLPSLADVRRLVTEFAILPLGSEDIHKLAPLNR
ncbi:Dynein regulatory complex protein 11 [Bulinus truncatus]|nr:Dynein regulatory complex protein 11 [Bulinus truncatus]